MYEFSQYYILKYTNALYLIKHSLQKIFIQLSKHKSQQIHLIWNKQNSP